MTGFAAEQAQVVVHATLSFFLSEPTIFPELRVVVCVGIQYGCYIKMVKNKFSLLVCSRRCYCCSLLGNMGACLLNKRRERRQNAVRMRVKRLQEMMEGEYTCRLRGL